MGGLDTLALLDTGADVSLIAQQLFQKLPQNSIKYINRDQDKFPSLKGVTGTKLKVLAKVKLSFYISTKNIVGEFYVLEHLKYPMVLGHDQFRTNDIMIDFYHQYHNISRNFHK